METSSLKVGENSVYRKTCQPDCDDTEYKYYGYMLSIISQKVKNNVNSVSEMTKIMRNN